MALYSVFPFSMLRERDNGYRHGSERFDVNYIERESILLLKWLQARPLRPNEKAKPNFVQTRFNDRDNRIMRRWGLK